MPAKTYKGSCQCGTVRFEATVDFADGTTKCNCTSCWKRRLWSTSVPPGAFRAIEGEAALSQYQAGQSTGHGGFCRHCGIHMYGFVPANDWNPSARISISVSVFDDVDPEDLIAAPVTHCDGRADDWWHAPAEVRHL